MGTSRGYFHWVGRLTAVMQDDCQAGIRIMPYLTSRKAQYAIGMGLKPPISDSIFELLGGSLVMLAIHFDDQPCNMDIEISKVGANRRLAPHMKPVMGPKKPKPRP